MPERIFRLVLKSQSTDETGRIQETVVEWTVQPAEFTVPPMLHATFESRSRYIARYCSLPHSAQTGGYLVRFTSPYVNYDTDTFIISSRSLIGDEIWGQIQSIDTLEKASRRVALPAISLSRIRTGITRLRHQLASVQISQQALSGFFMGPSSESPQGGDMDTNTAAEQELDRLSVKVRHAYRYHKLVVCRIIAAFFIKQHLHEVYGFGPTVVDRETRTRAVFLGLNHARIRHVALHVSTQPAMIADMELIQSKYIRHLPSLETVAFLLQDRAREERKVWDAEMEDFEVQQGFPEGYDLDGGMTNNDLVNMATYARHRWGMGFKYLTVNEKARVG